MPQISVTDDFALAGLLRVFTPFDNATVNMAPNETSYEMPTLAFAYSSLTQQFNGSSNESVPTYSFANRYGPTIRLMKGVPPTYDQLNTILDRNSDVLVTFTPQSLTNPNMWVNNGTNPSIYLQSTDLFYASASGTATWLWWTTGSSSGSGFNSIPYIQATFTVGAFGSGSDFELPTTDIVSGRGYKLVNGPKLTMATEFNY
jgi:hypothetical protein